MLVREIRSPVSAIQRFHFIFCLTRLFFATFFRHVHNMASIQKLTLLGKAIEVPFIPKGNAPMVKTTQEKVNDYEIINLLHRGKHIDDMTKKWLSQTPNPPRIPVFYTLINVHKPTPVGRPMISGCDGPTERISSFVDTLLQPIAQIQQSFIKDTTDFINFIEKTKIGQDTILV